jgi:TolB-like protein/Tfp pilus assembly protein PilF
MIQVAETVFPAFGLGDDAVRLVVILLVIGFLPTLLFAWVFELTPKGLTKEVPKEREHQIVRFNTKSLDRIIIVLLAMGLGYFAIDKFVMEPQREARADLQAARELATATEEAREEGRAEALATSSSENSIAVLAFEDMSPEADQGYMSDGIAEELLNLLVKVPNLNVISRTSAFSFKGKDLEIPEIARRLGVDYVLEGSVRKADNEVRITVQLIEARSDTHVWSETYDRTLEDIFAIQDEISGKVVEQLKVQLFAEAPRARETNPEAYALYLQARYLGRLGTPEGHEQAIELLKRVLETDPDYAPAWVSLSSNYNNQAGKGLRPAEEGYMLAREAAENALAIDSGYAPAYSQLGWYEINFNADLVKATGYLGRALALDPSDLAIVSNAAVAAVNLGRFDQAIALLEYTSAHDPVNPVRHNNLGHIFFMSGQLDNALESFRTVQRLSPGYFALDYRIGLVLLLKGEAEAALKSFSAEDDDEYRVKGSALALYALGRMDEHEAKLRELIEGWGEEWPSEIAPVYAWTGDADSAFEWLARSVAEESGGFDTQDPLLKTLHGDPRWLPLLESLGKSPEQLDAIEFEISLPH